MRMADDFIWSLKYRPRAIEDVVLPEKLKKQFSNLIKKGKIGNILLSGRAGTGKTTSAFILGDTIDADVMYMNLSDETGVEGIRTKVRQFVSSASFGGKKKVFIGDECLEENEEILVGTVDDFESKKLKDLPKNTEFPIISFNRETGKLENDTAEIFIDRMEEVFLIEFEDGRTLEVTGNHPLLIASDKGYQEKSIDDGLSDDDEIVTL